MLYRVEIGGVTIYTFTNNISKIFITVFVWVLKFFSPEHCSCNTSPSSKTFEVNGLTIDGESINVGSPL